MLHSTETGITSITDPQSLESLVNPDGVAHIDQLWDLVKDERDLTVVLRTDQETFHGVDVRAWWNHGRYPFEENKDVPERNNLAFEVSDEVTRRIQSKYAQDTMRRFLGQSELVELPEPFTTIGSTDATRRNHNTYSSSGATTSEVIVNDWLRLRNALEQTASAPSRLLDGDWIRLLSTAGEHHGLARVTDRRLEIYIPEDAQARIQRLWKEALRREFQQ